MRIVGNKGSQFIPWLDNMRLMAMVGVLSFHFWIFFYPMAHSLHELVSTPQRIIALPFQLGWEADDLFFAVSGMGLALSLTGKRPDWLRFIVARAKRIYIPYWVTVVAIFAFQGASVAAGTWDRPFGGPFTPEDWVCNVILVLKNGFNPFSTHYWFLYALIELYLVFPLLYMAIKRYRLLAVAAVVVFHSVWIHHPLHTGLFSQASSVIFWLASFAIGMYIGINLGEDRARTEALLRKSLPLGVLLFVTGTVLTFYKLFDPIVHPMLGLGGIIVAFAICSLPWHLPRLTQISFEVYLVHMPFIGWYRHFFGFVEQPKVAIYVFYMVTVTIMGFALHFLSSRLSAPKLLKVPEGSGSQKSPLSREAAAYQNPT
ncbi:acyltransferase family protein [Paraburkholderia phenazinium]|uniref:Peptidoglycan/LPS O-acetylase OafA/YrhL, contains acyltransferase and SGNH-hydrolase domains n=1 Tax=Paraburkholderia phenazinium TaxID=60549 RepID=A0A1N6LGE4_9BURK|nr:acyltransferase [Paraburkholderia phenazinium]SIO67909.1 Peptidoglycan/LPS O-acetylase OafA/YrhL, contains acyltransferase and SGNH-hydrolase domains [Paraburkholderia phenazinium]